MKSNKTLLFIVLTILATIVVFFVIGRNDSLVSPIPKQNGVFAGAQQSLSMPAQSPNTPKVIKYDSTTNLEQELETVNPQVGDSDFEE